MTNDGHILFADFRHPPEFNHGVIDEGSRKSRRKSGLGLIL